MPKFIAQSIKKPIFVLNGAVPRTRKCFKMIWCSGKTRFESQPQVARDIYRSIIIKMASIKGSSINKKRYAQISLKKRQILVTSVIDQGESLTKVAKKLKIKLSTAKLILKKFKKTGILMNKKLRNTKKEKNDSPIENYGNLIIPTFEVKQHRSETQNFQVENLEGAKESSDCEKKTEESPAIENNPWTNTFWYTPVIIPFGGQYFFM